MTTNITIAATIFGLISGIFFNYKLNHFGNLFVGLAVVLYFYAFFVNRKESKIPKESEPSGFLKIESYGTDENTALVIKSIGTAGNGFINFGDIVNDTNLPLKTINTALDWLVVNKLATENKGRKGKVYELTPKGRDSFSSSINSNKRA